MKLLLIIFLALSFSISTAQTRADAAVKKVKDFYITKNAGLVKGTFYFNKSENIIEIIGAQIPLFDVKCTYFYSDASYTSSTHMVQFDCSDGSNCIPPNSSGFGIPFKTKDDCYTFINLIYELKKAIR